MSAEAVPLVRVGQLRGLADEAWVAQPWWRAPRHLHRPGDPAPAALAEFLEEHGPPPWPIDVALLPDRIELLDAAAPGGFWRRIEAIRRWCRVVVPAEPVGDVGCINAELCAALARRRPGFAGERECDGVVLKLAQAPYPEGDVLCCTWVKVTRPVREGGGRDVG